MYTGLASVLFFAVEPAAWSVTWVRWAHIGFVAAGLLQSAALLYRPHWTAYPGMVLGDRLLSLAQAGAAVVASGGAESPLVLLYPVALMGGVSAGFSAGHWTLVGVFGFSTFLVATVSQGTLGDTAFLAVAILMLFFFLNLGVVANVITEKSIRLERSHRALEKFASGLKSTNEKLERLSFTDGVTGVYNYRYFQLRLREELSRARRYGLPLALMMVDVDGFKHYNDAHGHPVGDRVLQAVAAAIKENVRELDTVCRYGGDEFAVILNDAVAEVAAAIGERVREAVARCAVEVGAPPGITISLGIAVYPKDAESAEELVKRADEALYRAKSARRDGIHVYSSVLEELRSGLGEVESPSLLTALHTLVTVINARDRYTYGHSERVMRYATAIGRTLGLDSEDLRLLRYAAFLHDIGKIEIGRDILNKREALTEEERSVIRQHTLYGVQIIEPIQSLERILGVVLHHHERYDGQGYPGGLSGEEIPLLARVLAVADAFDAMLSHRPYRDALSVEDALQEIRRGRGTQFDPRVADALLSAAAGDAGLFGPYRGDEEVAAEGHQD